MAITIQDQPTTTYIRPAFAPIEYLVSSDNTAQSGFKIVCKVYLNPTGANTLNKHSANKRKTFYYSGNTQHSRRS
jgi:hypothetical protein